MGYVFLRMVDRPSGLVHRVCNWYSGGGRQSEIMDGDSSQELPGTSIPTSMVCYRKFGAPCIARCWLWSSVPCSGLLWPFSSASISFPRLYFQWKNFSVSSFILFGEDCRTNFEQILKNLIEFISGYSKALCTDCGVYFSSYP